MTATIDADRFRLPATVVPRRYDLRLAPDLPAARFDGEETIEIDVREPIDEIVLNAVELDITGAELDGVPVTDISYDAETERATLPLGREVASGPARLHLAFTGTLTDRLRGCYRSTFA